MRNGLLIGVMGAALALSGCGKSDGEGNNVAQPTGEPVAAVPAPKDTRWSETVVATPAGGYLMGNPKAAIQVIEYGSYSCSHCAEFAKEVELPLAEKYVDTGKVSFEFRNFVREPVDLTMGLIARCGGPAPFFSMTNQLMAAQAGVFEKLKAAGDPAYGAAMQAPPEQRFVKLAEVAGLIDFAKQRGLPEPQVRACLADTKAVETAAKHTEEGGKQFNIQGTPTIIINGKVQENVGTWPALEAKLKEAGA